MQIYFTSGSEYQKTLKSSSSDFSFPDEYPTALMCFNARAEAAIEKDYSEDFICFLFIRILFKVKFLCKINSGKFQYNLIYTILK